MTPGTLSRIREQLDALLFNLPASSSAEDRKAANEQAQEKIAAEWLAKHNEGKA